MTKKVIILHGWAGTPLGAWRGWLVKELRTLGFDVEAPYLTNPDNPKQEEWLKDIREINEKFDDNTVIVGHSLGAVAALRLLETFSENEKINTVILVCGFTNKLGIDAIRDFFKTPFNWKKIKNKAGKFVIINSDNDPYMNMDEGKKLKENLGGELIIEHNAGHMNEMSGYVKYPRVLEIVKMI